MAKNFFRGIAFPFKKSSFSLPAASIDNDLIKQSLLQVLTTAKGERVMRPDFGSNVYAYVFENNDLILQETLRADVMSAIAKYETRVIVQGVDVERQDESVVITVGYVIVATKQTDEIRIEIPTAEGV